MAAQITRFRVTLDGVTTVVVASRGDYVRVERQSARSIYKASEDGYLEPVLRLCYVAAQRQEAIPAGLEFDAFLDSADVEILTDDDGDDSGNE